MSEYLIVETRDLVELGPSAWSCDLIQTLCAEGAATTLYLADNGVLAARRGVRGPIDTVVGSRTVVMADRTGLEERGMAPGALCEGVEVGDLDVVLDALKRGVSVLWR